MQDFISTLAAESGGSVFTHSSLHRTHTESKLAASIFGRVVASSAKPKSCQVRLYLKKTKINYVQSFRSVIVYLIEKEKEEWCAMNVWFTSLILSAIIGTSLQWIFLKFFIELFMYLNQSKGV